MKYLTTIALLLTSLLANAQVKGNGKIVTKTYDVTDLKALEISLYAKIDIDCSIDPYMSITTDENVIDLIDTSIKNGRMDLNQKEWLSASKSIIIKIGAPNLERVQQGTHETVFVIGINADQFNAMANVGEISLQGKTERLNASGEIGTVHAKELLAKHVHINLWDDGTIYLGSPELIDGIIKSDGKVIYKDQNTKIRTNTSSGGEIYTYNKSITNQVKNRGDHYFINFKLKNNSGNRINCYVVGPKNNGKKFSYGFPMNPGQVKNKDWSVGSKVFRVTGIGTRKLLKIIEANDEGNTVYLYDQ